MTKSRVARVVDKLSGVVPGGTIATRTARSGLWTTATNVSIRGLQTVLWVVLASVLGPEDVGLMGIALLTLLSLNRFSQLGIDTALIQHPEDDVDAYLDTAWTLKVLRGLLLGALTFLAAPLLAELFGEPRVTSILQVIALSPVIQGFRNPGTVYFKKDLDFHRDFAHRLSGAFVEFGLSITLAFLWGTVWALVFGYLVRDLALLVGSYLLHSFRPRPRFDRDRARTLLGFGKWITGSGIVYFLITDGDDFVVGALLSAASLGLYQLAYRLANAPTTEVTGVLSTVVYPAFSKLQDDLAEFRELYYLSLRLTTFVSFPMAIGIIVVSPSFVAAFLGSEWLSMITTMQIIAAYSLLYSVATTLGPVWNALGRPDIGLKIGVVRLGVMAALIVPATTRFGIDGAAAVVIIAYLFPAFALDLYLLRGKLDTTLARFLRELSYPLAASLVMGAAVLTFQSTVPLGSQALVFGASVVVGVLSYALAVLALDRVLSWGIERTLHRVFTAIRGAPTPDGSTHVAVDR